MELMIAVLSFFLDDYAPQAPRSFDLITYLNDRDSRNAEEAYADDMRRLGWRA
jgi:hypothetical protein